MTLIVELMLLLLSDDASHRRHLFVNLLASLLSSAQMALNAIAREKNTMVQNKNETSNITAWELRVNKRSN